MYEPGQVLQARYQLQQQLGRTAASRQTWLTTDLQSHELVLLKLLAFDSQMDWQELELFEREAKILQTLNHPQIPRYRDYFALNRSESNPLPWFVLVQDYIAGSSLQEFLDKSQRFSQTQIRQIAEQLLHILQYLHELSPPVLHRDIKPSNIILGNDKRIYLVDFGAVQDKAAVTGVSFTVVGTSGYAPFEQFYGRAVPASDLYALGATLIHLLTGIVPVDLLQSDGSLAFAEWINLDPTVLNSDWLQRLTALDLNRRFTSAREALKALHQEPAGRIKLIEKRERSQKRDRSELSVERRRELQEIARLELENKLLRIDLDWEAEQEQYKVRPTKHLPPRLPDIFDPIGSAILGIIVIGGFLYLGIQFSFAFFSGFGSIIGIVSLAFIGQSLYYGWKYRVYREALEAYQQRRADAIAWYEQKRQRSP